MSNRLLSHIRAKIDFETKSELDVREVGAARYAEHPTTEILCMGWKLGGAPRQMWTPDQPFPQELISFAEKGGTFEAHNAMFECAVWLNILHKRMGIIMPKRWYDTMARCAQRALPMGLEEVGRVLELDIQKDKKGKYLLQKLTKPRKPSKKEVKAWGEQRGDEPMPLLWHDSSALVPDTWEMEDGSSDSRTLFEALCDYCARDVDAEDVLGNVVGDMDENEYRLWVLDQTINWRGVQVDVNAVESALAIVAEVDEKLCAELAKITDGSVTAGSQVARIKEWALSQLHPSAMPAIDAETDKKKRAELVKAALYDMVAETGINLLSLAKDQVEEALGHGENEYADEIDETVSLEDDGSDEESDAEDDDKVTADSPPWKKVKRVLNIRQQLSRASTKKLKKILECMCSDGRLRGMLQYHGAMSGRWAGRLAQPHNFPRGNPKIIKKGIEPLIAAIKCRSADLLTLYYGDAMDAIASALRGMFVAAKNKTLRVADFSQIEARVTMWLAGEEEALEAFLKSDRKEGPDIYCVMAMKLYNRPINKDNDPNERQLGKITILGCGYQMGWQKLQFQAWKDYKVKLTDEQAQFLVTGYRESFPKVKELWYGLQEAAISAVMYPDRAFSYRGITYCTEDDEAGHWLACELPNGRKLWYFEPQVDDVVVTYQDGSRRTRKQIGYWGRDNKNGGRWNFIRTYGGMLTENVVQAISRDIMAESMVRVELAGYPIILTVHDEVVSETDEVFGVQDEFEELMKICPVWIPGCPINVEGWSGPRYKKA